MVCATLPDRKAKPEGLHVCVGNHGELHQCESCGITWEDTDPPTEED